MPVHTKNAKLANSDQNPFFEWPILVLATVVLLTSDEHDDDREYLLREGVGGHVPEAHGGEGGAGVVEGGDVGLAVGDAPAVGEVQPLGQEVKPA